MIRDAIKDELEAIQKYEELIIYLKRLGLTIFAANVQEIQNDEKRHKHIFDSMLVQVQTIDEKMDLMLLPTDDENLRRY
jgi:rubrerythrin